MAVKTTPDGQIYTHKLPERLDVTLPETLYGFECLAFLFSPEGRKRISRMEPGEARKLYDVCEHASGFFFDIGTRHGGSALLMAVANPSAEVLSIDISPDIHTSIHDCVARFDLGGRIRFVVGSSRDPIPGACFGVICFDGDHTAFGISQDIIAHWNAIKLEEGQAVFHDVALESIVHNCTKLPDTANDYQRQITPIVMFLLEYKIADFAGGIGDLVVLYKRSNLTAAAEARLRELAQILDPRPNNALPS